MNIINLVHCVCMCPRVTGNSCTRCTYGYASKAFQLLRYPKNFYPSLHDQLHVLTLTRTASTTTPSVSSVGRKTTR